MIGHRFKIINEFVRSLIYIIVLKSWIIFDRLTMAYSIETKPWRRAVVIVINMRKNVCTWVFVILSRSPNHFHTFFVKSFLFVLIVNSRKEKRLKSHLTKKRSRGRMMPEWVDMPSSSGNIVKSIFEPSETYRHLIDKIFIIHTSLVRHTPACIDKL